MPFSIRLLLRMLGTYYKIKTSINTFFVRSYLQIRFKHVKWAKGIEIRGGISIKIHKSSVLSIGDNCIFNSNSKFNLVGINKKVTIAVSKNSELVIGRNCGFSGTSIYAASKIVIGDYCNFGGNVFIWDTDFHPLDYAERRVHNAEKIKSSPVIIGDDVFVGANSIILKGVKIGTRSIIGAGSVVTKDIPADEIWAGNPARYIRKIQTNA